MNITAEDLLDLLPIVDDKGWHIDFAGFIRDRDDACPVCSMANEVRGITVWRIAAHPAMRSIGAPVQKEAVASVVAAADWPDDPLRPALMRALGMKGAT